MKLIPKGGNDKIYTPDDLAQRIVDRFKPSGRILEPCRGSGAFTKAMPGCHWCELDEGIDFLAYWGHWDWIVTNPPYSKFRAFLNHSMEVADNVVFLAPISHMVLKARRRDIKEKGFGVVSILEVDTPKSWPQSGFQLAATHIKLGYGGLVALEPL